MLVMEKQEHPMDLYGNLNYKKIDDKQKENINKLFL